MNKDFFKKLWQIGKKIFVWLFILQFVYIIICKWIDPPITITQINSILHGYGLKRDYVGYDEISPNIKLAVIASEDQLFATNNGFNFKAIKKAYNYNNKHEVKRRGGSTISQQTAKNVFLWQHGGYFRKALEVYFTFMIEKFGVKKEFWKTI